MKSSHTFIPTAETCNFIIMSMTFSWKLSEVFNIHYKRDDNFRGTFLCHLVMRITSIFFILQLLYNTVYSFYVLYTNQKFKARTRQWYLPEAQIHISFPEKLSQNLVISIKITKRWLTSYYTIYKAIISQRMVQLTFVVCY